jgi:hypothetical protein
MTDTPERIWVWVDYDGNWDGTWLAISEALQPERLPDGEYIRADIAEAEKRAAVEEALEQAAEAMDGWSCNAGNAIRTLIPEAAE